MNPRKFSPRNLIARIRESFLPRKFFAIRYFVIKLFSILFIVDTSHNAVLLSHILDILSLCVEKHTFHIRSYIIEKNVLARVLVLMTSSHGHLVLGES